MTAGAPGNRNIHNYLDELLWWNIWMGGSSSFVVIAATPPLQLITELVFVK